MNTQPLINRGLQGLAITGLTAVLVACGGSSSGGSAGGTTDVVARGVITQLDDAATISEGGTVTITATELSATDDDGDPLTFNVSGVTGGQFELTGNPGVAITSFTQDDLDNNRVVYVHDGSQTASDSFDFSLADGGEDGAGAATGRRARARARGNPLRRRAVVLRGPDGGDRRAIHQPGPGRQRQQITPQHA